MLRFVFTDVCDEVVELNNAVSVVINKEEGVPADDLAVVFPYVSVKELKNVVVYDNETVVFTGIVDEQIVSVKGDMATLKVCARSMASLLLDNESVPLSYNYPSQRVVVKNHANRFGINVKDEKTATYFGTQTVGKGSTNWLPLDKFSKKVYGKGIRVDERGELIFAPQYSGECVFSNDGDGIAYTSLSEVKKRCEEISKVRIKLTNSSGYHSVVENEDAVKRGIVRERYLNAVLTDTPAVCADNMIRKSKENAYVVTINCPGRYLNIFGMNAKIKGDITLHTENLYISSLIYRQSSTQEMTTVILKRKEV